MAAFRGKFLILSLLCLVTALASCVPGIDPDNEYDPDAPESVQKKAALKGTIVTEDGRHLSSIEIVVDGTSRTYSFEQGKDMSFVLQGEQDGLVPGLHSIEFKADGYEPVKYFSLNFAIGDEVDLGEVRLNAKRGTLTGTAVLDGQNSHAGTGVLAVRVGVEPADEYFTQTGTDGSYTFRDLPVGEYRVSAFREGYFPVSIEGNVTVPGTAEKVTLYALKGAVGIKGEESDPNGYTSTRQVTLELKTYGYCKSCEMQVSQEEDFQGAQWQDYPASGSYEFTLSSGDGTKTVFVRYREKGSKDEASPAQTGTVVLDTKPPRLAEVSHDTGVSSSRDVELNLFAFDETTEVKGVKLMNEDDEQPTTMDYSDEVNWRLPEHDGLHTVTAIFFDLLGNESDPVSVDIVLDTSAPQAPSVEIVDQDANAVGQYVTDPRVWLALSAVDDPAVAEVMISEDEHFTGAVWEKFEDPDGDGVMLRPWTLSAGDGTKKVYAKFRDAAGQETDKDSAGVILDTTPPSPYLLQVDGGKMFCNQRKVTVTFSAQDATSGIRALQLSNDRQSWSQEFDYEDNKDDGIEWNLTDSDGLKTVWARFIDQAGNVSFALPAEVFLDRQAPTEPDLQIKEKIQDGLDVVPSAKVTLLLSINDSEEGTEMLLSENSQLLGGTWEPFAGTRDYFLSAGDGDKTVYACFRDAAGNLDSRCGSGDPVSATIKVDTVPPAPMSLEIEGGAEFTNSNKVRVTFEAQDATSGVAKVQLSNDGSTWDTPGFDYSGTKDVGVMWDLEAGDGLHEVYARFVDEVGHVSAPLVRDITVDTVAPDSGSIAIVDEPEITRINGLVYNRSTRFLLKLQARDDNAVTDVILADNPDFDGAEWIPYDPPDDTNPAVKELIISTDNGPRTLYASFRDAAGNVMSTPASVDVIVDTMPPVIYDIETTQGSYVNTDTADLFIDVADNLGNEVNLTYSASGPGLASDVNDQPLTNTVVALASTEGLLTFDVTVKDMAGNESEPFTVRLTKDTTPPVAPDLISASPGNRTVRLDWEAGQDRDIVGYVVYYGIDPANLGGDADTDTDTDTDTDIGGGVLSGTKVVDDTHLVITDLMNRYEYYFSVAAMDRAGNLSPLSDSLSAVPGWTRSVVTEQDSPGRGPSLAVERNRLWISYREQISGTVRIASCLTAGGCETPEDFTDSEVGPDSGTTDTNRLRTYMALTSSDVFVFWPEETTGGLDLRLARCTRNKTCREDGDFGVPWTLEDADVQIDTMGVASAEGQVLAAYVHGSAFEPVIRACRVTATEDTCGDPSSANNWKRVNPPLAESGTYGPAAVGVQGDRFWVVYTSGNGDLNLGMCPVHGDCSDAAQWSWGDTNAPMVEGSADPLLYSFVVSNSPWLHVGYVAGSSLVVGTCYLSDQCTDASAWSWTTVGDVGTNYPPAAAYTDDGLYVAVRTRNGTMGTGSQHVLKLFFCQDRVGDPLNYCNSRESWYEAAMDGESGTGHAPGLASIGATNLAAVYYAPGNRALSMTMPEVLAPMHFTAMPGRTRVQLSWDTIPNADGYRVRYAVTGSSSGVSRFYLPGGDRSFYEYNTSGTSAAATVTVSAVLGDGEGSNSTVWEVSPFTAVTPDLAGKGWSADGTVRAALHGDASVVAAALPVFDVQDDNDRGLLVMTCARTDGCDDPADWTYSRAVTWTHGDGEIAADYDIAVAGDYVTAAVAVIGQTSGGRIMVARCNRVADSCDSDTDWIVRTVHGPDANMRVDLAALSLAGDGDNLWVAYTDVPGAGTTRLVRAFCRTDEPQFCSGQGTSPSWTEFKDAPSPGINGGLFPSFMSVTGSGEGRKGLILAYGVLDGTSLGRLRAKVCLGNSLPLSCHLPGSWKDVLLARDYPHVMPAGGGKYVLAPSSTASEKEWAVFYFDDKQAKRLRVARCTRKALCDNDGDWRLTTVDQGPFPGTALVSAARGAGDGAALLALYTYDSEVYSAMCRERCWDSGAWDLGTFERGMEFNFAAVNARRFLVTYPKSVSNPPAPDRVLDMLDYSGFDEEPWFGLAGFARRMW